MRTINVLAPKWSELFNKIVNDKLLEYDCFHLMRSMGLDIANPAFCLVGEAHKFTEGYAKERYEDFYCRICDDFACDASMNSKGSFVGFFYHQIIKNKNINWRDEQFIKEFEQHMITHENDNYSQEEIFTIN